MLKLFKEDKPLEVNNNYELSLVNEYIRGLQKEGIDTSRFCEEVDELLTDTESLSNYFIFYNENEGFTIKVSYLEHLDKFTMEDFSKELEFTDFYQREEEVVYRLQQDLLDKIIPYTYGIIDGRLAIKTNQDNFKQVVNKLYKDFEVETDEQIDFYVDDYNIITFNNKNGRLEYLSKFFGKLIDGNEFVNGINKENQRINSW